MAVPRLRSEKPFIELDPKKLKCSPYAASSIKGASQYGLPVTLDQVRRIDLVVCGSVAVNRQGARVGKGGGYSDLEFALLTENKKIAAKTPIVTSVHYLQVIKEEIPMTVHDIPLTAIVTLSEESRETLALADSYISSRVVPINSRDDARHIAIATVAGLDAVVSWNFKHIVNLRRRRIVHSVNVRLGYPLIELVSPEEVLYE